MSDLTEILKGIAYLNWQKSGFDKKALPHFEKKYKEMYYNAPPEKKQEMRKGFEENAISG